MRHTRQAIELNVVTAGMARKFFDDVAAQL
jgi:hypothetical protein